MCPLALGAWSVPVQICQAEARPSVQPLLNPCLCDFSPDIQAFCHHPPSLTKFNTSPSFPCIMYSLLLWNFILTSNSVFSTHQVYFGGTGKGKFEIYDPTPPPLFFSYSKPHWFSLFPKPIKLLQTSGFALQSSSLAHPLPP